MFINPEILLKIALNDPSVTSLTWGGNGAYAFHQISKAELLQLGNALKNNTHVTSLYLSDAWFDHDAFATFATLVFENNVTLKKVSLIEMNLWGKQIHALIAALTQNTAVTALDLSRNPIGDETALAFLTLLQTNTTLEVLTLSELYWNADGYGGSSPVVIAPTTLSAITRLLKQHQEPGNEALAGLSIFSPRVIVGTQTQASGVNIMVKPSI